jgi:hypothetical protein
MRYVYVYLIAYFALAIGAAVALGRAGVLQRMSGTWLAAIAIVVVVLGLLVAATAAPPPPESDD